MQPFSSKCSWNQIMRVCVVILAVHVTPMNLKPCLLASTIFYNAHRWLQQQGPIKKVISPCLCWRGAPQRLLKRYESFMRSETPPLSISDEKAETLAPAWRGNITGFSRHSNCCCTGCTYVWRSCKLLNYTLSVESVRFFANVHLWHWECLAQSITIWHSIFRGLKNSVNSEKDTQLSPIKGG